LSEEPDTSPAACRKAAPLVFTADVRSGEAGAELRRGGNAAEGWPAAVAAAACTWACLGPAPMGTFLDLQPRRVWRRLSRGELLLQSPAELCVLGSTGGTATSLGDALARDQRGEPPTPCKALQKLPEGSLAGRHWGSTEE